MMAVSDTVPAIMPYASDKVLEKTLFQRHYLKPGKQTLQRLLKYENNRTTTTHKELHVGTESYDQPLELHSSGMTNGHRASLQQSPR